MKVVKVWVLRIDNGSFSRVYAQDATEVLRPKVDFMYNRWGIAVLCY